MLIHSHIWSETALRLCLTVIQRIYREDERKEGYKKTNGLVTKENEEAKSLSKSVNEKKIFCETIWK